MPKYQTDETLTRWIEKILAALPAQDFGDSPLYAVSMPMMTARGLSAPGLAATYESEIRAAKKWHGRGQAVLIDSQAVYADTYRTATHVGLPAARADKLARRAVAGVLVHEFAHALAENDDSQAAPIGGNAKLAKIALSSVASEPMKPQHAPANPETFAPWAKHDARFIRAACHLTARMRRDLPDLTYREVVKSEYYSLSPIDHYVVALLDELKSKIPIRSLLATRAPRAFRDVWKADFSRWWQSIPGIPTPKQYAIAAKGLRWCHE